MERGRPVKSIIRENITEIIYFMKKSYGYNIFKVYNNVFPKVTLRSIYYNLKKGVALGDFKIGKISSEKGNYSWGNEAEKIYYVLANAKARGDMRVRKYLEKKK